MSTTPFTPIKLVFNSEKNKWLLFENDKPIELANNFLRSLDIRGLSVFTLRAYAYDLLTLYRWLTKTSKEIGEIQQSDLLGFIEEQRKSDINPRSINRRLSTCRSFYRFCTDKEMPRGKQLALPASHYKSLGYDRKLGIYRIRRKSGRALQVQAPKRLIEPLSREQVVTFLQSFKRYRDLAIFYSMVLCGLRAQEVLNLRLSDLCFEEQRIRIKGKGNKERAVPAPQVLETAINDYLRFERPLTCKSDSLFVVLQGKRQGQAMTYAGLRSLFRHRRLNPLLTNANIHRARHTFGSNMARAGVRTHVLQKLMGHSDIQTTAEYISLSLSDVADEYFKANTEILKQYKRG